MDKFARIVVGYHGCSRQFAHDILLGTRPIADWELSENAYDWLGKGIYFWEHSPERALRWAQTKYPGDFSVVGAIIQLGRCFDLMDETSTLILKDSYKAFESSFVEVKEALPRNEGRQSKLRKLDCAVINDCIDQLRGRNIIYDTVRGAFLEGEPIFDGTSISSETHIQIAVRNIDLILGVFRPNLETNWTL